MTPHSRREATIALPFDAPLSVLSRHQVRRRQGVPTLTVLAARGNDALPLVRRWAESEGRPVCVHFNLDPKDALASWAASLDAQRLISGAYVWLASQVGRDVRELAAEVRRRSEAELAMFLDCSLGSRCPSPVAAACRTLIEHGWLSGSTTSGLWRRLIDACDGDMSRALAGITAIVGDERTPVLYAEAGNSEVVRLRTVMAHAAALASVAPAMPIVVSAVPERVEEYLAETVECRAVALLREGLVWLSDDGGCEAIRTDRGQAPQEVACGTQKHLERKAEDRLPSDDEARSAAERYLYERLEAHTETAGLFELNGILESGGGRALEIDLLARSVRVAVEIDGYYHFTDRDAYRRDREKDVLLQHAGYFVVRCLAEDVAGRLEQILGTILAAVRRTEIQSPIAKYKSQKSK